MAPFCDTSTSDPTSSPSNTTTSAPTGGGSTLGSGTGVGLAVTVTASDCAVFVFDGMAGQAVCFAKTCPAVRLDVNTRCHAWMASAFPIGVDTST
jgi:hypothetical protein